MGYRQISHTAEVRFVVEGKDLVEVFRSGLAAVMDFLKATDGKGAEVKREIRVSSDNRTELLIDFLSRALSLAQINEEVYRGVEVSKLTETELVGRLEGQRVDGFDDDIKAVTYHEAQIKEEDGRLKTMIIIDV